MNKHIELVKKWLADPDSVTQEELKQNCTDADAAAYAAAEAAAAAAYAAYAAAAYAAAYIADAAAAADAYADAADADAAAYWVERYEALEKKS